jgi:cell division protein FtsN
MANAYGNGRKFGKHRSSTSKQFFWVLVSFVGGYLAATVFDFTSLTTWINTQILKQQGEQKTAARVVAKQLALPKPKFEFYTLLTKDHHAPAPTTHQIQSSTSASVVTPSTSSATIPAVSHQVPAPVTVVESEPVIPMVNSKESYLLQIASFKNKQEAERMQAALILKGFDVHVVMSSQQKTTWFRVVIGPFHLRKDAEKTQLVIARSERITGMIRKMDAYTRVSAKY